MGSRVVLGIRLQVPRSYVGARGSVAVTALDYKPEGCGFDSQWYHWNFSIGIILLALGFAQLLTEKLELGAFLGNESGCLNRTGLVYQLYKKMDAVTFCHPKGLLGLYKGYLYLYLFYQFECV